MTEFKHIVTKEDVEEKLRCSGLLRRHFRFSARLRAKIKKEKAAFLNGEPITGKMAPRIGDELLVVLPEEKSYFTPEPIPIYPIFEDDQLLVINKQPGIVVHPTHSQPRHTIAGGIAQYMLDTGRDFKIRFVNRLDMDTSGLLVLAKNAYVQDDYVGQQQAGKVEKEYLAVVKGTLGPVGTKGTVDAPIGRADPKHPKRSVMEDGRPCVTHYQVLEIFSRGTNDYALAKLFLETGRTHQIRVHLSHLGHPIVGDYLYGGEAVHLMARQALHAQFLSFDHPITKERLRLEAPLPDDMSHLIDLLRD